MFSLDIQIYAKMYLRFGYFFLPTLQHIYVYTYKLSTRENILLWTCKFLSSEEKQKLCFYSVPRANSASLEQILLGREHFLVYGSEMPTRFYCAGTYANVLG